MKLLVNICAHDGIISHFAGVGTIVKRYIKVTEIINKNVDYHLNLFTPKYNEDSFGYSKETKQDNYNRKKTDVFIVSNGSDGKTAYGTIYNWNTLSINTAKIINEIDFESYDYVITIANDTPFASLPQYLKKSINHYIIWIPHSTVKIHEVDSAIENSENEYNDRLKWENEAIEFINKNNNCFVGSTGRYIENHLISEYGLKKNKSIFIPNGEIVSEDTKYLEDSESIKLFENLKNEKCLIMSYGRAEKYKNLESTMYLGDILNIPAVVITKAYFYGQPIIKEYEELAKKTKSYLFVDVPFNFPHYIINHFDGLIVLLIPSRKEIVGLIINEVRKMNKDNVLIVANDIGGLSEQIDDGKDGILVDLSNLELSAKKIKESFNKDKIEEFNKNSQIKIRKKYNFEKTMKYFYVSLLGDEYARIITKNS